MADDQPKGGVRRRTRERQPAPVTTLDEAFEWDEASAAPPDNLRQRLQFIKSVHPDYRPIFINLMMFRLVSAGVPYDMIAHRFGVSMPTVFRWLTAMRQWVAEKGVAEREEDVLAIIGESLMTYDDTKSQLLSIAGNPKTPPGVKVAALRGVGSLEDSKNKVRQVCGLFDGGPLRRTTKVEDDARAASELRRIGNEARKVMERFVTNAKDATD